MLNKHFLDMIWLIQQPYKVVLYSHFTDEEFIPINKDMMADSDFWMCH